MLGGAFFFVTLAISAGALGSATTTLLTLFISVSFPRSTFSGAVQ